ncbi:MAG TPA: tyrosine-type recombinase/integrase [Burkholderiales bacterium]
MATTVLRERMRSILRTRNYSLRTEETYLAAVSGFARHFGRPPDQLGSAEVTEYQIWLRQHKKVSASLFNQTVCALRFFYGQVMGQTELAPRIAYARGERHLPVVLSIEETTRFLAAVDVPRYHVLLMTIYSAGLRLGEGVSLRASDIDSSRMVIRIRQGKGKKDRYVPLSPRLLSAMREHWRREHLSDLLFPSLRDPSRPVDPATVERFVRRVAERAGFRKRITPRTLRHSYATHLIENGTSTRVVQVLLGHADVHTTETYTHVSSQTIGKVFSPLDRMMPVVTLSPGR